MRERELEERLRAEKATPTTPASNTSQAGGSRLQRQKSSQQKLIMGAVKRSSSRKDSEGGDAPGAKKAKDSGDIGAAAAVATTSSLGALAGLGDYSSSEDED